MLEYKKHHWSAKELRKRKTIRKMTGWHLKFEFYNQFKYDGEDYMGLRVWVTEHQLQTTIALYSIIGGQWQVIDMYSKA